MFISDFDRFRYWLEFVHSLNRLLEFLMYTWNSSETFLNVLIKCKKHRSSQ